MKKEDGRQGEMEEEKKEDRQGEGRGEKEDREKHGRMDIKKGIKKVCIFNN